MAENKKTPWTFLDEYRGKTFSGEWPTFPETFSITASRFPDRPCFTDFEGANESKRTVTYAQALANIKQIAAWLTAQGIVKGDKIAVTGKNSPEWATAFLASLYAGATVVPLDYALHENEVDNLVRTALPKIIFVDEEKFEHYKKSFGGEASTNGGASHTAKILSLSPKYPDVYAYNLRCDNAPADAASTANASPIANASANAPTEDDVAAILFTSGTTSKPKGVMLTHKNLISDCFIAQTNFTHYETDVFYALLPIHHGYTMQAAFINPLSTGAQIVFGKSMAVTRMMRDLRDGGITIMLGVPLLYNKLLAGIKKGIIGKGPVVAGIMQVLMELSYIIKKVFKVNPGKVFFKAVLKQANIYTLRTAICGGGPLSPNVFKAYNAAGINFIQGYGLTETSPIIALNPVAHFKIESVGKDFAPYEEMKILNPDAEGVGEIVVKGPMVMKGYYNMPEETAKVFTPDGFFKTGDIGRLDDEHYLMLLGRAKNIIVTSGGKNVYPEEIEDAFQMCDDIQQIVVQGYSPADDPVAEEIEALVYPSDSLCERLGIAREAAHTNSNAREAVQSHINDVNKTLQPYARISRITILSEPMAQTTTMKVKRNYK